MLRAARAPAIANAIHDAVGVRIRDLPIAPEKILAALREARALRPVPAGDHGRSRGSEAAR